MSNRLDIIVFGASGFTGKHTIPYVYKLARADGRSLTWGVAGRSEQKLKAALAEAAQKLAVPLDDVPIVTADVDDGESLKRMAERARIVVNCCGPYRFYGEPVVRACIEAGTHHVDVSGEPQYMESIQLKYHEAAVEKGVYVVSACGFDSIPTDLGVVFLQEKFEGTLNSVEMYLESHVEGSAPSKPVVNYGTWQSAIHSLAHANELRPLREQLYPERLPSFQPKLKSRSVIHKNEIIDSWCAPFPGSDRSVVLRSQRFFYESEKKRPIQFNAYVGAGSLINVLLLAVFGGIFALLTKFQFGLNLLLKYPSLFSLGYFSHEGPSEETQENTVFSFTLYGEGWKEKLAEGTDEYKSPTDSRIIAKVKGRNPGYGATCVALTLAGITVITETDKLPNKGGVYPPGAAFAKTSLIEQLNKNGLTFEIVSE